VKRTPWISWRLYFLTIPIDVIVLLLSGDHASTGSNDFLNWAILALLAHASIAPVMAIALFFTSKFNTWKSDLSALLALGAVRGIAINIGFEILELEPKVSFLQKVVNSTISLPLWFIGLAVFFESRRQFQREFEALFLRSIRKEQVSMEQKNVELSRVHDGELIKHLQSVTWELASEIEEVLNLPTFQGNYSKQLRNIQELIKKELRPVSAQLWNESTLSTPQLSIMALIRISLLGQQLRVVLASFFFAPYIFIGLYGSQGLKLAAVETVFATCFNILIFLACERLLKLGIWNRKLANLFILGSSFLAPFLTILFLLPENLFWTDKVATIFLYQLFLTASHVLLLLGFNLYKLLSKQRSAVLHHLEEIIRSESSAPISQADLTAAGELDLARYLHGELQAGLVATSLLLERASKTGDADLAKHALRSAVDLLRQDHARVSQSRISSPKARLEKVSSGWQGIAEVTIALDRIDEVETSFLNDVIALIDEAVSNAVRHAGASVISVEGKLVGVFLDIEIISDGSSMTHNAAGLGTKLFTELATSWDYSRVGDKNSLKFTVRASN
jgi:signal transduction histidine kinase